MASNISEIPKENPPSWATSAGTKLSGDSEGLELPETQRINSSEPSSGDFISLKEDGEMHGNVDTDSQVAWAEGREAYARCFFAQPSGPGTSAI